MKNDFQNPAIFKNTKFEAKQIKIEKTIEKNSERQSSKPSKYKKI